MFDLNRVKQDLDLLISNAQETVDEYRNLRIKGVHEGELLEKTSEVFRQIQELASINSVEFISSFLTRGIRIVFDRDLEIKIEIGDRGDRKTAEIWVIETKDNRQIPVKVTEGVGGGIQVVLSFLLQVLVILNRKLNRTIFIDEQFTQVSNEYIDGLFELFVMLIDEFDFKILLITHDKRMIDRATKTYEIRGGEIVSST